MELLMLLTSTAGGFFAGYLNLIPTRFRQLTAKITDSGIVILLTVMGLKIGANESLLSQFGQIGVKALILALLSISGSILVVAFFDKIWSIMPNIGEQGDLSPRGEKGDTFKTLFILIGSLAVGVIVGWLFLPENLIGALDQFLTYALCLLLFGIGITIGSNRSLLKNAVNMGWKLFLIPTGVALGSIVGSGIGGLLIDLPTGESAAVGAGFGWYSLSGVLLTQIEGVELGSLAFMTNIFRELISIVIIPLTLKYFGEATTIAPGGATTMDVTLPILKEAGGPRMVIPGFLSGATLSVLVPVFVPLLTRI